MFRHYAISSTSGAPACLGLSHAVCRVSASAESYLTPTERARWAAFDFQAASDAALLAFERLQESSNVPDVYSRCLLPD